MRAGAFITASRSLFYPPVSPPNPSTTQLLSLPTRKRVKLKSFSGKGKTANRLGQKSLDMANLICQVTSPQIGGGRRCVHLSHTSHVLPVYCPGSVQVLICPPRTGVPKSTDHPYACVRRLTSGSSAAPLS